MTGKTRGRTPQVLVVDDEPGVRELLVDALADLPVHVDTAATGAEAIAVARQRRPDIVVTDMNLGDCTGLDVIETIRSDSREHPSAVVITGMTDPTVFAEASRYRPVELMAKPLDIERLRRTIREELDRKSQYRRTQGRTRRLRKLARKSNIERKAIHRELHETCAGLTAAYRTLSGQLSIQQVVIGYQQEMIAARADDDVFRSLFRLFVQRSGAVFGIAMVCDAEAELQMIGRFGVPYPDASSFCGKLVRPVVARVLAAPRCSLVDAWDEKELFDESLHRFLPGVTILPLPLIPAQGELIGLVVLYRKGEQPFTDADMAMAEVIAPPTALAVRRND